MKTGKSIFFLKEHFESYVMRSPMKMLEQRTINGKNIFQSDYYKRVSKMDCEAQIYFLNYFLEKIANNDTTE